jgi:hypothetical protein
MNVKLKVGCIRGRFLSDECVRIVAIDDSSSLYDLHDMIQDAVSFERDHPFTFYTANSGSPWAEKNRIAVTEDWEEEAEIFARIKLCDIWPLGRKKLYYWFDFGDDWIFEIRKIRSTKADASLSTPTVLEGVGPDPQQYPVLEDWDDE